MMFSIKGDELPLILMRKIIPNGFIILPFLNHIKFKVVFLKQKRISQ